MTVYEKVANKAAQRKAARQAERKAAERLERLAKVKATLARIANRRDALLAEQAELEAVVPPKVQVSRRPRRVQWTRPQRAGALVVRKWGQEMRHGQRL